MIQPTRGERNNNPMNLERTATIWKGQAQYQPDSRFLSFDRPNDGIRAGARTLHTYFALHGLNTVRRLINRYAPARENDTDAYINHVAHHIGVGADDPLNLDDPQQLAALTRAVIMHENGRCIYTGDQIATAVDDALGVA